MEWVILILAALSPLPLSTLARMHAGPTAGLVTASVCFTFYLWIRPRRVFRLGSADNFVIFITFGLTLWALMGFLRAVINCLPHVVRPH